MSAGSNSTASIRGRGISFQGNRPFCRLRLALAWRHAIAKPQAAKKTARLQMKPGGLIHARAQLLVGVAATFARATATGLGRAAIGLRRRRRLGAERTLERAPARLGAERALEAAAEF